MTSNSASDRSRDQTSNSASDRSRDLTDLAARRLGGFVVAASDEWFGAKEALLDPQPPVFDPARYATRGKVMDGWETRRHSPTGDDWVIVRLGAPGVVRAAVIDTTHFRGNAPTRCALDGCSVDGNPPTEDLRKAVWVPLLPASPVQPDRQNRFAVTAATRVTHVRLTIFPDGGVARLRLLGDVVDDLRVSADRHGSLDLASARSGGQIVAASEEFFSPADNLLMVGDARDMHDGWETRRRRDEGHDWVIVRLATTGLVDRVEIHTTHFLGNHPETCAVEVCDTPDVMGAPADDTPWQEIVAASPLGPHARHVFDIAEPRPATHLRLTIHPDGGVARLRAYGRVTSDGWRRAGVRWLDTALDNDAAQALAFCCGAGRWVEQMIARRPFGSFAALTAAADQIWGALDRDDRLEAFAAHPRIGDRTGSEHTRREQAGTAGADATTLEALVDANRAYEQRFGHVFLINASGRSAEEMLAALRQRMANDPVNELEVAAEQQLQITRRRLDTLMHPTRRAP
jgi:allantoicase